MTAVESPSDTVLAVGTVHFLMAGGEDTVTHAAETRYRNPTSGSEWWEV
jgi:hypothetical protein